MKKITLLFAICFLLIHSILPVTALAVNNEKKQEVDCAKKQDIRNKEYNEAVMEDIFSSFGHKYDEIIDQSMYVNFIDLMKYTVLSGEKTNMLESLKELMEGKSVGEKRIYFFHGDPNTAYIFYKDLENQNIAVHIERSQETWAVKDTQIKKGKKIPFIREKCEDDYFMKRMFNNLYQKQE